jgi:hypothetical protein
MLLTQEATQVNRQQSTVLRIGIPAKIVKGRKARFAGMKTTSRSDARRRKASADARLAKITPGRNARRSIRGRKARFVGQKSR